MKKYLLLIFTLMTVAGYTQINVRQAAVYSDPALTDLQFESKNGERANTDILTIGETLKMNFKVSNLDRANPVEPGTCQIKISLGTKFNLVTDLTKLDEQPFRNYFNWKVVQAPKSLQYIVIGELVKALPVGFSERVSFELQGSKKGSSTITCQILISNHNSTQVVLSDMNPLNNYLAKGYTNYPPFNLKFTLFSAMSRGCMMDVKWAVKDAVNEVSNYVIETSADGKDFKFAQAITANANNNYGTLLQNFMLSNVMVRVRAEAVSGQYVYSDVLSVNDLCKNQLEVGLYPNPLSKIENEVTIQAKKGIFNGKYIISITDAEGKELSRSNVTCNNQVQVKIKTEMTASGNYFISIKEDGGKNMILKLVKL